ncbi:MAG: C4-dicarboxylate ABC transporter substrate-binding protein [Desulfobacteraceae bacterium]|nr:MAG: C4-dicarboxylate ABC transporter substrate-binding protein [Desulfobacteraceae bacterium]
MKKITAAILFSMMSFFLMSTPQSIGPSQAMAKETIQMKFANFFPPASAPSKLCEKFIADIEERTGGRVKITYYPGGSLAKAPAMAMAVMEGAVDIGFSHVYYTPGRMPVTEVAGLPLGYPNPWVGVHVMNDFYDKFKPKEWEKVRILWMHSSGVTVLMTKKPVRSLEDMKGVIIRAPGEIGMTIKALGGTPAPTTMSEAYDALSKGVIHGAYTGVMGLKDWRFAEVVGYTTLAWQVGSVFPFYVAINKDRWAKLPADIRAIFDKTCEEYKEHFARMWNEAEINGKEFGAAKGVEFIELNQEEAARWKKAVEPVMEDYVKQMAGKGFAEKDVRSWISFLKERIDFWTKRQLDLGIKSATGPKEMLK